MFGGADSLSGAIDRETFFVTYSCFHVYRDVSGLRFSLVNPQHVLLDIRICEG
jgi:hypothetical protein